MALSVKLRGEQSFQFRIDGYPDVIFVVFVFSGGEHGRQGKVEKFCLCVLCGLPIVVAQHKCLEDQI